MKTILQRIRFRTCRIFLFLFLLGIGYGNQTSGKNLSRVKNLPHLSEFSSTRIPGIKDENSVYCRKKHDAGIIAVADNGKTLITPPNAPLITSISPTSGPIGSLVKIRGMNLNNASAVTIGKKAAVLISNDGQTLVAMVMPGTAATGTVSITANGSTATSATGFTVTETALLNVQKGSRITTTDDISQAALGSAVDISADGTTAIVGAPADDINKGAIWIYTLEAGRRRERVKLIGAGAIDNAYQGSSVSISADGNTAMVGAPTDDNNKGAIWIFTRNANGIWSQQGNKLVVTGASGTLKLGTSVSLSADGNTAVVGGPGDNSNKGAIWIFTRTNGVWGSGSKFGPLTPTGNSLMGTSVAISADGNTIIAGGPGDNNNKGAVWVYKKKVAGWTVARKISGVTTGTGSLFGASVDINADGRNAILGVTQSDETCAVVILNLTSWGLAKLSQATSNNTSKATSVSISADGNTAVMGGSGDNNNQGAIWIYKKVGTHWILNGSKIVGGPSSIGLGFGKAVALSADRNVLLAGAPKDSQNRGAVGVFLLTQTMESFMVSATGNIDTTYGPASAALPIHIYSEYFLRFGPTISIPSNNNYELSLDGITAWSSSIYLAEIGNNYSGTVYIRSKAGAPAGPRHDVTVDFSDVMSRHLASLVIKDNVINKAPLTITPNDVVKGYSYSLSNGIIDDASKFTSNGLVNYETITLVDVSYGAGAAIGAPIGTYTDAVTISNAAGSNGFNASNYNITYKKGSIIVAKGFTVSATGNIATTYGTASAALPIRIFSEFYLRFGLTISIPSNNNYELSLDGTSAWSSSIYLNQVGYNYSGTVYIRSKDSAPASPSHDVTVDFNEGLSQSLPSLVIKDNVISPAPLIITANNVTKTYGDVLAGGSTTAFSVGNGLKNRETITSVAVSYGIGAAANAPVGTYANAVTISSAAGSNGFNASNYNITYQRGNIIVNEAPFTASATGNIVTTYGTASVALPINIFSKYYLRFGLTISIPSNNNYELSLDGTSAWSSSIHLNQVGYNYSGTVYIRSKDSAPASPSHDVTVVFSDNTPQSLPSLVIKDNVISPAPLIITANNVTKTYGDVLTGGSTTAFSVGNGLKNRETITSVAVSYGIGAAANAAVGTYVDAVTISSAAGSNGFIASNYNITYQRGNIIVNEASFTVSATGNIVTTYGTASVALPINIFSKYYLRFGLTISIPSNNNYELSLDGTSAWSSSIYLNQVGNDYSGTVYIRSKDSAPASPRHDVTVVFSDNTPQSLPSLVIKNNIISPAPLIIKANNVTKTYGDVLSGGSTTGYSVSGRLRNGETITSATVSYGAGAVATDNAGTYTAAVTISNAVGTNGFNALNYNITYNPGSITVNKAPLTLTLRDGTKNSCDELGAVSSTNGDPNNGGRFVESIYGLKNGQTFAALDVNIGEGRLGSAIPGTYYNSITYTNGNIACYGGFSMNNYYVRTDAGRLSANLTVTTSSTAYYTSFSRVRSSPSGNLPIYSYILTIQGVGLQAVTSVYIGDVRYSDHIQATDNSVVMRIPNFGSVNGDLKLVTTSNVFISTSCGDRYLRYPDNLLSSKIDFSSPLEHKSPMAEDSDMESLKVYPNPVSSIVNIDYLPKAEGNVVFSVVNMSGFELASQSIAGKSGERVTCTFNLKEKGLASGTYIVRVTIATETLTRKVIVE